MEKRGCFSKYAARVCACVLIAAGLLAACGDGSKIIFTPGMSKNDVFRIGGKTCTVPEMKVYLVNTRNQYERVYGSQVWKISLDGVSLEENVKETVLAKLAQIKTMCLLAESKKVELNESEKRRVEQAAEEYFGSLNDREKEVMEADEKVIEGLYEEYAVAEKVFREIIKDVNPEISDDEARTITVQQILFRTYAVDDQGNRTQLSGEAKRAVYQKACEVYDMAVDGEHDFADLASRYSEDAETTRSFGKGDVDEAFEQAAFALETGEVSQVTETEEGYRILRCVSTFDKGQTDTNKLEILEKRRREAFGQEYDAFIKTLARQLNEEVWEGMTVPKEEGVATWNFFEIYGKYFPEDSGGGIRP